MPLKKSPETGPAQDQGALFEEVLKTNGAVDIDHLEVTVAGYDDGEGSGVFPEVTEEPDPTTVESATNAAAKAIAASRQSNGQRGSRSPLQQYGSYLKVEVGHFLPDFGPVTHSNFDRAKERAKSLEAKRLKGKR